MQTEQLEFDVLERWTEEKRSIAVVDREQTVAFCRHRALPLSVVVPCVIGNEWRRSGSVLAGLSVSNERGG